MSLVGDIIVGARELAPDLLTLPTQSAPSTELTVALAAGGALPTQSFLFVLTYLTAFGETLANTEALITPAGGNLTIRVSLTGGQQIPPGVQNIRLYVGPGVNLENGFVQFTPSQLPFSLTTTTQLTPGKQPSRSTAYLPDMDGKMLSVGSMYRFLNDGIKEAARLAGGIPDYTGVPSVVGQGLYVLTGLWNKIEKGWYDGYPLYKGSAGDVFRRTGVTGQAGGCVILQHADERHMIEIWPQPSRTAGSTTTTAQMATTDSSVTLTASNFTLGFGLALLSNGLLPNELVWFSSNTGGNLTGLIRGMGGTRAQAWPSGSTVQEANLFFTGKRMVPPSYSPGDSLVTLSVPAGWEPLLKDYILGRIREGEQKGQDADRLYKRFVTAMKDWLNTNKQITGPVQINPYGARGAEVVPGLGSPFGGVLLR